MIQPCDELRHLVELALSELRDLAHSGWSARAERHALELADAIEEKLGVLVSNDRPSKDGAA